MRACVGRSVSTTDPRSGSLVSSTEATSGTCGVGGLVQAAVTASIKILNICISSLEP